MKPDVASPSRTRSRTSKGVVPRQTQRPPVKVRVEKDRKPREEASAFTIYLREIGETKLLNAEEEAILARQVQAGNEEARTRMIKANLRLVVKIARDYEHYGVPLLDLISEGNIGLMKAVERFDPTKGARLSTYAAWWIKQAIRNALINQSKTIRLPARVNANVLRLRAAIIELTELLGREPSDAELAARLRLTTPQVVKLRQAATEIWSMNAPLSQEGNGQEVSEIIEDEAAASPYTLLVQKTDEATLRQLLKKLPAREALVLRLRFGLNGRDPMTLEDIGADLGLTRERIRQIEVAALKRLRAVWPNSHASQAA